MGALSRCRPPDVFSRLQLLIAVRRWGVYGLHSMYRSLKEWIGGGFAIVLLIASGDAGIAEPASFQKQILTGKYYCDGISAGDVNRDGKPDIVAGPFWY